MVCTAQTGTLAEQDRLAGRMTMVAQAAELPSCRLSSLPIHQVTSLTDRHHMCSAQAGTLVDPSISQLPIDIRVHCSANPATTAEGDSLAGRVAAVTQAAELPSCPGGSFPAVFGQWLALGLLSRRRIAALAEAAAEVTASICVVLQPQ